MCEKLRKTQTTNQLIIAHLLAWQSFNAGARVLVPVLIEQERCSLLGKAFQIEHKIGLERMDQSISKFGIF